MANVNAQEWALKGIRAEKQRVQAYLTTLNQQEQELVQSFGGTTSGQTLGTASRGVGRPRKSTGSTQTTAGTRGRKTGKRTLSEETRAKMRAAQRARHAAKSGSGTNTGETVTTSIPQPDFEIPASGTQIQ